jgi:dolichol-phosphate mannosyltransferase
MGPVRTETGPIDLGSSRDVQLPRLRYCIILPAYNESRSLARVVGQIPEWVSAVVIVDDASSDDTLSVAESLSDPRVAVIHHDENMGVGGAMVSGYRFALAEGYDVAVKMDADGQMDIADLPYLARPIELGMAEYAKGNRFRRTGRPKGMPRTRWLGSVMLSFLTKVASGYWHVFDPQCGFTAITTPTLERLKLDGIACDYFFENDMLIRLNVVDARVVDVSIAALYGDESSTLSVGRVTLSFPLRLLRGFLWRFIKRHVVNDFGLVAMLSVVGAASLIFGLVFGIYHWAQSSETGNLTPTGTVMIAVVPIILGVQLLLQALALEVQGSAGAEETRALSRPSLPFQTRPPEGDDGRAAGPA